MNQEKFANVLRGTQIFADIHSKDMSTKVGAAFVDPDGNTILSRGYNGMPRGINDRIPERHFRPLKYDYFEHAERNAIYNLARQTLAGSTALCTAPPDISSARALVSVGVSAVYWLELEDVENEESLSFCKALFREAGIDFCNFKGIDEMQFTDDRMSRKLAGNMQFTLAMSELMSKDPKRSGALFLNKDFTTLTEGYSGQPRGAKDDVQTRYSGAERATWVESSIRNAIYNLVRPILRGSVLTVTFTTCVECARAAVAVGAQSVVYREPNEDFLSRWGPSVKEALAVLDELQVPAHGIRIDD